MKVDLRSCVRMGMRVAEFSYSWGRVTPAVFKCCRRRLARLNLLGGLPSVLRKTRAPPSLHLLNFAFQVVSAETTPGSSSAFVRACRLFCVDPGVPTQLRETRCG